MSQSITTTLESDTIATATEFATTLKPRDIVLFEGDLGAGKSVFCRGVIRALTATPDLDVPSPTFTLIQTYDTPTTQISHFDLYRLKDPEEIFEIGWEDALASGIVLVEWPDRLGPYTPKKAIRVTITISGNTRQITIHRPT